ncbi:Transposase-associated domain [Arabidopsis thaliana x Arabidopsis arenosa]|uniref:Transposase-associated domain n=1 Tax=Arabidopsis thaliana x Arabidopsis arenosa TaxID=1240361 RepID=A0A8T1YAL9_9BRAS|nr:Transposase-associated domain [Arabidopsis thaliana x Arabidopsis arenosa]
MDKSWITKHRISQDYINGVKEFLDFAFGYSKTDMIKCPCQRCFLVKHKNRTEIEGDLVCHGFLPTYTNWYLHGEELDFQEQEVRLEHESDDDHVENPTMNLLGDVFPSMSNSFNDDAASMPTMEDHSKQNEVFDDLLADCNEALYEGCHSFSKLSFMLKLYHIKCITRISDKGMSMILDLLKEAFEHAKFPKSFNDMKKIIRKLGFNYENIHVCPNDCMLFWGDDASRETCKVCESSRWKTSTVVDETLDKKKKKKQQAAKVLRYFPLKPRLQRFFMSSKTAKYMRWHADSENKDGKLRHPRDGKAWKSFDGQFPEFASDPRNVRLGLATDGFNPFGSMNTNYSVWPVLLFPYNFPPWMSMKQTSIILSMIIPGKHMPGNDIDIYLQPLIQELRELWFDGVPTFDAASKETFSMRAVLLWTISDFPGLGNLSGWNIYTGLACPSCNYDAIECRLRHGKKYCYMGHRRFLPQNHNFRGDKQHFDGCIETRDAPITQTKISGKEVWGLLNRRVMVDFNRRGQVIKDSGGLFGSWLGSLSNDLNILPINYTDWRKVPNYRKEMAWKVIQKKFWFDNPRRRKKYVLSALGVRCRDLKQRIWMKYRRNTIEEAFEARPGLIPEDQWKEFVEMQFTDKAKRVRERNINSRNNHKMPHTLGKKSLARKANEMEEETGKEPNRAELFIASRTRSDGSLLSNEARITVDKLSQVMTENIQDEASNTESRPYDAFEQVFGSEPTCRVRCVGRGVTPSKYLLDQESVMSSNAEILELKTRLKGLEDKLEIVTDALFVLVKSKTEGRY